jgi:paraquat-inducible protein A
MNAVTSIQPQIAASAPGPLRECPDCGLFQHVPIPARREIASCSRCSATLRRHRVDPHGRALALSVTGILMFALATQLRFIKLDLSGQEHTTTLISGPVELEAFGMWELSLVVLATTIAAPLAKLLATAWVMIGLRLRHPPRHLYVLFRLITNLSPWSMIEVFLLGVFVAYTKLEDLAEVQVGGAVYALGALMLAMAAADAAMDPDAVWETLERKGATCRPCVGLDPFRPLIACDCCGLVSSAAPTCQRCGETLRTRKPNSLNRTIALLAAAALLYLPANILPVITVISFGQGYPSTILGGVFELGNSGMWPLALLVFFASITVPVLKLVGLSVLIAGTRLRARGRLAGRTRLFRIVDAVGRWSMIDVFMISILTALVRMGTLASVFPGAGVLCFCAVVILTMLAAMSFDPRLMWDAAGRNNPA